MPLSSVPCPTRDGLGGTIPCTTESSFGGFGDLGSYIEAVSRRTAVLLPPIGRSKSPTYQALGGTLAPAADESCSRHSGNSLQPADLGPLRP